jgi:selenophosphate synthetase-related protein
MGFILTVKGENVEEVCRRFADVGMTAASVGEVNRSRKLTIRYLGRETQVFDLDQNGIMRIFAEGGACR